MNLQDSTLLITGGTGSFGRKFTEILYREVRPRKIIIFSRDELKQHEMRLIYPEEGPVSMRYFIGDVRDLNRLRRALKGVDIVVHAAALKQVPACEYNPVEAIRTNIDGARNLIDASLDQGVKHVIAISTDKAVNPINLYGASKLCAEKLLVQGNTYVGDGDSAFSCVRYGNVAGTRGSVVPLFLEQKATGILTLTDPRMTRFWITLEEGARFVLKCIMVMRGGEVFVPKIPSINILDLAEAVAPDCEFRHIGVREGEKLHELLLSADEARHASELDDMYVIHAPRLPSRMGIWQEGKPLTDGFSYASDTNTKWLSPDEIRRLLKLECLL